MIKIVILPRREEEREENGSYHNTKTLQTLISARLKTKQDINLIFYHSMKILMN